MRVKTYLCKKKGMELLTIEGKDIKDVPQDIVSLLEDTSNPSFKELNIEGCSKKAIEDIEKQGYHLYHTSVQVKFTETPCCWPPDLGHN